MTKEQEIELGNKLWDARQAFIAEGHSQTFVQNTLEREGDTTVYCFQPARLYQDEIGSLHRDNFIEFGPNEPMVKFPVFSKAVDAIAWLEKSPVPGMVQRFVAEDGQPTWMTAGIAHEKFAGERDYKKGRELVKEYYEKWF